MTASKIIHVHIPKTAGKSLRAAFRKLAQSHGRKVFETDTFTLDPKAMHEGQFDLISGHFGFCHAIKVPDASIITVLREPKDRFLSFYYYLRQKFDAGEHSRRSKLANRYNIDEFVNIMDDPDLIDDFWNSATWQLAYGTRQLERLTFRLDSITSEDDLLRAAIKNLNVCAAVGFQHNMSQFGEKFAALYNMPLSFGLANTTKTRLEIQDIKARTLRKMDEWVYLDSELYRYACKAFK